MSESTAAPVGAGDLGVVYTSLQSLIAAVQAKDYLAGWLALRSIFAEIAKATAAPDPAPAFTATEPTRAACCEALAAIGEDVKAADGKWIKAFLDLLPLILRLFV